MMKEVGRLSRPLGLPKRGGREWAQGVEEGVELLVVWWFEAAEGREGVGKNMGPEPDAVSP